MKDFIEAYDKLMEGFQLVLSEMIEDGTIKHLSLMGVSLGTPELPYLELWVDEPFKNITDTGLSETFEGEIILSSQVLNNKNPNIGIHEATSIVSQAEHRIISSRLLGDLGFFNIKTKDFGWVPYGLGKKKNVYSAGVTFQIRFKIKNPKCDGS